MSGSEWYGRKCDRMTHERTLQQTRERIDEEFLGEAGIHATDLRPQESLIVVYAVPIQALREDVRAQVAVARQAVFAAIRNAAHPYRVRFEELMPAAFA